MKDSLYSIISKSTQNLATRLEMTLVGGLASYALLVNLEEPKQKLMGLSAIALATTIDHLSTIPVIKLMNTPEFKKSGLAERFKETNPFIGSHPSMKEYFFKNLILDPLVILTGYLLPEAGYAYLFLSPFLYRNNKLIHNEITHKLESQI